MKYKLLDCKHHDTVTINLTTEEATSENGQVEPMVQIYWKKR